MSGAAWRTDAGGAILSVRVTPRASRDSIATGEQWLAVRLRAPPVDGAANAALIVFLADRLAVPKSAISIVSGESARLKRVRVAGDPERLASLLATL